jgi:hypothetical protein
MLASSQAENRKNVCTVTLPLVQWISIKCLNALKKDCDNLEFHVDERVITVCIYGFWSGVVVKEEGGGWTNHIKMSRSSPKIIAFSKKLKSVY